MPSISSSVKLTKLMTQNFEVQRHCQSVQHLDSDAVLQFINHFVIVFHHSRWYQNITTLYNAHTCAIYHAHNVTTCYMALCVGNKPSCRCTTVLGWLELNLNKTTQFVKLCFCHMFFIFYMLYSVQHWRFTATCAAALT